MIIDLTELLYYNNFDEGGVNIQNNDLLTINEVCRRLRISRYTLENWYRFKREFPEDELAMLLPDYHKEKVNSLRFWKKEDIKRLREFKNLRKLGRNGQMSNTIQKYVKKRKEKENGNENDTK